MRRPSVNSILLRLNVTREQAKAIRALIDGGADPDKYQSVERWVRQCYNPPLLTERIMEAINEVLDGHGVEAIWSDESCIEPAAVYVNMGDPWTGTVVYDIGAERYRVEGWGDFIEAEEKRGRRFP